MSSSSIVSYDALPVRKRSGRQPRLSDEAVQDLATALKANKVASEAELAKTKSAAYQRAGAAREAVLKLYPDLDPLITAATEVSEGEQTGWRWFVGRKTEATPTPPAAETPDTSAPAPATSRRRQARQADAETPAAAPEASTSA